MKNITVMGAGGWGIALAKLLAGAGHDVALAAYLDEEVKQLAETRENPKLLPGVKIPDSVRVTGFGGAGDFVRRAGVIVCASPSIAVESTVARIKPFLNDGQIIVNVAKGLDEKRLLRLSEVIENVSGLSRVAVLSGPTHAEEVAAGVPSTIVAASRHEGVAEAVQDIFMTPLFRVYTNPDVVGVELGGALKNIIALAVGIADGLGYGDNAKAAIMTRGLAEISRLGRACGADAFTFSGLSGMGDLIVTCTSVHSRNRRAGILLGRGFTPEETLKQVGMVVEGINTARAAMLMARKYNVELPITAEINNVLFNGLDVATAVRNLLARDKTSEISSTLLSHSV